MAGDPGAIAVLLKAGADGSMKDSDGKTPFDYADKDRLGEYVYWQLNDARYK